MDLVAPKLRNNRSFSFSANLQSRIVASRPPSCTWPWRRAASGTAATSAWWSRNRAACSPSCSCPSPSAWTCPSGGGWPAAGGGTGWRTGRTNPGRTGRRGSLSRPGGRIASPMSWKETQSINKNKRDEHHFVLSRSSIGPRQLMTAYMLMIRACSLLICITFCCWHFCLCE